MKRVISSFLTLMLALGPVFAEWAEIPAARTDYSKTWKNKRFPRQKMTTFVSGTVLHENKQEVNMAPSRALRGPVDGYEINRGRWHYFLGKPQGQAQDGWVGFGAKKGRSFFWARLQRIGYVHWPTKTWDDLGGPAVYNRNNFLQSSDEITLGPAGAQTTMRLSSQAAWHNIWTIGGGEVQLKLALEARRLKSDVVIDQTVRDFLNVSRPALTPPAETYLTLEYKINAPGMPAVYSQGQKFNRQQGVELEGDFELRSPGDETMVTLPSQVVYVIGDDEHRKLPLKVRFFREAPDDKLWVGVNLADLAALPAGFLVFDPTFETQPDATAGQDAMNYSIVPTNNFGTNVALLSSNSGSFIRGYVKFDVSSIPSIAVCNSSTLTLYVTNNVSATATLTAHSLASGVSSWTEAGLTWNNYKSATAWPGSAGSNTAGTDYETAAMGTGTMPGTAGSFTISLDCTRTQAWWTSGTNYGIRLSHTSGNLYVVSSSDETTASQRPKLTIAYTDTFVNEDKIDEQPSDEADGWLIP